VGEGEFWDEGVAVGGGGGEGAEEEEVILVADKENEDIDIEKRGASIVSERMKL